MVFVLTPLTSGCANVSEYFHNGFKVGPNYAAPPAPVAREWIDAGDVRKDSGDLSQWWSVFKDPVLNDLVCSAYQQNLSLKAAGFRVLQARAQRSIDIGKLLPQTQTMNGDFTRYGLSSATTNSIANFPGTTRFYSQWDYGFNLSWELDFWGRLRRAIESDTATLDASVDNYDDVLVTLLGDVATYYVNLRTYEQRIQYFHDNVKIQKDTLKIVNAKFKAGVETTQLDVAQAQSTVEKTEAQIPELEIGLRQANNQLCILLGIPPQVLQARLKAAGIPVAPADVAAGIPADLLRRRPDVRKAERQAAAQSAQIGIAAAEFYPHISINGTLQYSANRLPDLFTQPALNGNIGPAFSWNILNYGRIVNNVRLQDAKLQELVATYQNTVLSAAQEVENGLVTYLRAQNRKNSLAASTRHADEAVRIAVKQYNAGTVDLTRVTQLQTTLVELQDTLAQSKGEIATGLIQVYRGLGGGWEIRNSGCTTTEADQPTQRVQLGTPRAVESARVAQ
jgi:NodT family efflux transporter outer membrane factor (OMF) lipoprotein